MTLLSEDQHPAVARRALEEVCARGDFALSRELYSPDFHDHVNALEFHGLEGVRESVTLYRTLFPDLRIEVLDQVTEGDRVASRWLMRGTFRGRAVTLPGITISRLDNGRIAEDWSTSDSLHLLRQLGVLRSIAAGIRLLRVRFKPGAGS